MDRRARFAIGTLVVAAIACKPIPSAAPILDDEDASDASDASTEADAIDDGPDAG